MTEAEQQAWSSAQLGEMLDSASPDDLIAIRRAGILPEEISGTLAQIESDYNPDIQPDHMPQRAENTEKYQEIVRYWSSRVISKAIHNGHDRLINRIIGVVEQETSIDGIDVYVRFSRWVVREAGITYLTGHMGSGKTDFALLMAEVFWKELKDDREVRIASNIKSAAEDNDMIEFIDSQPELKRWLEKSGIKFFIFDEASSHATGYSGDSQSVTEQMRSTIRLIRKKGGSMALIGHDGKDLHPTIRELADFVEKQGKKDAGVFEGVSDREGENRKFDISQIPETSLSYDTKEASSWKWASEAEKGHDRNMIIGEIYEESDLTQQEIADIFGVSRSQVSEYAQSYRSQR